MTLKRVVVYLSNDEYNLVKKISRIHGLSLSSYLKLASLRRYIGDSGSGTKIYKDLMRGISISDNFNSDNKKKKQITVYFNKRDYNFIEKISEEQSLKISSYIRIVGTGRFIGKNREARIIEKELEKIRKLEGIKISTAEEFKVKNKNKKKSPRGL